MKGTLKGARELGLEALQVFTGNPRGWALSEGQPGRGRRRSATGCAESGIRVVVHAPYLVNLGSPTPLTYERSVASVAHNLRRAVEIGAEGRGGAHRVVRHSGQRWDRRGPGLHEAALKRVREGLLPVLEGIEDARDAVAAARADGRPGPLPRAPGSRT